MTTNTHLEWDECYSIGIPRFDEHHKQILEYLNQLIELDFAETETVELHGLFDELTDYLLDHIREEEQYMRQNRYPDFKEHKRDHDLLVAQTKRFYLDATRQKSELASEIVRFHVSWLKNHVNNVDMRLKEWAIQQRA